MLDSAQAPQGSPPGGPQDGPHDDPGAHAGAARPVAAVALAALGIVYGDIGTSPLYALREAARAASGGGGALSHDAILGVLSVIFWSVIIVVSLKYAVLIMRADNRGEGGIVAMLALLGARDAKPGTWRGMLLVLGLVGAALLYGDGVITPAISVLSAIEGLKLDAPQLAPAVVPITLAILLGLFLVQRQGTAVIGAVFGPIMLVWFALIGVLGLAEIARVPSVLAALNPYHAVDYLLHAGPGIGFAVLGAAFLAVTGGEAMYADMGHFGRRAIRLGWFCVALPGLVLNYFGQGALLLSEPEAIEHPFFHLAPDWLHYPLVAFATAATIIASQAIISGAFSLTQQAIQLGFLPRMRIVQTASHERGQIYVPLVNWLLALATLGAVLVFETSDALAGAYGIAVSALMAITTILAALIALKWGYSPWLVVAVNGAFLCLDLIFFAANAVKLFEGGWFPLLIAFVVAFTMLTWRKGAMLLEAARARLRQPEAEFLRMLAERPPYRIPGTAAFLTSGLAGVPISLTHHLKHNRVLHECVLLVCVVTTEAPRVPAEKRLKVETLSNGVFRVVLRFGFMESPDVPCALAPALGRPPLERVDPADVTYYLRRETVMPTDRIPGMMVWRENLFAAMHLNANRSAAYFCLPVAQVVEVGLEVEI
ncbi:potassium transporter Kup [Roseomonas sp. NAR14]|uniref:Probable potassium transport system protein Kup n=1 Tax=Roseomonas acroporae TaxID=2937791 RepID=A0A9X2BSG4_9PROT|nr:potassium transporter Kup [Roseomonas acroporae]MCK8783538.1 potassium transporter Kup [Roseomonas acroporae]